MAYTAEKVITEVTSVDRNEFKIYEPKEAVDMLDKAVTIKNLVGSYRLDRLQQDKQQYEAQIEHLEAQIIDVVAKIAAVENIVTEIK